MFLWLVALLNVGLTLLLLGRLASFAKRRPSLSTREDLDQYRSLITVHMLGTLLVMATVLLIPVVIVAPAIFQRGYVAVNWWPVAVIAAPLLFRTRLVAIENRCRSLQVSPPLAAEYANINKVWTGRALPRFPSNSELASDASKPGDLPEYQAIRTDGHDDDLTLGRDSVVMTAIGLGEGIFGLMALLDEDLPELYTFGGVLLVLGGTTFIGATLLGWRIRIGYHISLVCAALQVLLPPIGSALGIWLFISMRRAQYAVSQEYLEARSWAQVQTPRPWIRSLLLGLVVMIVHGWSIFAAAVFILRLSV